jgi:hypothetical protein
MVRHKKHQTKDVAREIKLLFLLNFQRQVFFLQDIHLCAPLFRCFSFNET